MLIMWINILHNLKKLNLCNLNVKIRQNIMVTKNSLYSKRNKAVLKTHLNE